MLVVLCTIYLMSIDESSLKCAFNLTILTDPKFQTLNQKIKSTPGVIFFILLSSRN